MDDPSNVLVFAEWNDPHAAAIKWALARNGVEAVVAPTIDRLTRRFSIHMDGDGLSSYTEQMPDMPRKPRSVWFRRPDRPQARDCHEADIEFIGQQWRYFQKNVADLNEALIGSLWVNRPPAAYAAEGKLLQLSVARELGMPFPELVVTDRAEDVARFVQRWRSVVYKTFHPHAWQSASSRKIYSMGVTRIDPDTELPGDAIAACPGIFQRYIDKSFDIRVTVVGDRLFAVKILKHSGEAYVDWRQSVLAEETRMEPVTLPDAWERHIRRLMQRLGLVFGCVDLVADRDGNLYFLEINQAGQFLFVEQKEPAVPLLRAVTAMLASARCDYSMKDSVDVRFADYHASDDHAEVAASHADTPLRVAVEA